jgi:hypothetical protein
MNKFPQNGKISNRLDEFRKKQKRQTYLVTVVWFGLACLLTLIFASIFQIHTSMMRNIIYSFVLAAVLLSWVNYIPFLGILITIIIRTRSKNYFKQLLPNLGLLIILTLVGIINFIDLKEESLAFIFVIVVLLLIVLESIFLHLVVRDARTNTKPLFIWTFFQDPVVAFQSTELTQEALKIIEQLNGYSQRPFFISFKEIDECCATESSFQTEMVRIASDLTEKGDLIGWDSQSNIIKLYPRILLANPNLGLGLRYLWDMLVKIIRKKGLTSLSINYARKEISLSISYQDYALLDDVTFHLLGQSFLERYKNKIIANFLR